MSGEVVAWLVNDSAFTSEAEAIEEIQQWGPSGSIAIPLVKASDLDALQAKLDAVTKDARWLLDLIDENEGRTAYSLRAQHTMTDIERRFTDQGRAGEG